MKIQIEEHTEDQAFKYLKANFKHFIGFTVTSPYMRKQGAWVHYFKPDRKYLVYIENEKDRINFSMSLYDVLRDVITDNA